MAYRSYIPTTDNGIQVFTANFAAILAASGTTYPVSTTEITDYTTKQGEFASLLTESQNPDTRGPKIIQLKNEARQAIVKLTRSYAQRISKTDTVSTNAKLALGIHIPKSTRTPSPQPTTRPVLVVTNTIGRTFTVEFRKDATTRGKPADVKGATLFYRTEQGGPWSVLASTTRAKVTVSVPPSTTGGMVQLTAYWLNDLQQSGPSSLPIEVDLPSGTALPSKAVETTPRLAA